jgi:uncharacterized protein (DUF58 family)
VLTWRAAIWPGIGAVAVLATRQSWVALVAIAIVVLLVAFDLAVAGALDDVTLTRDGDRQVRLGDTARIDLTVTNNGPRPLRARVRDAWVPSAGAHVLGTDTATAAVDVPPGEAVRIPIELRPTRRGDRPAARVSVRSYGPLGHAYRQSTLAWSTARTPAWTLRVLPRFDSRRFLAEKVAKLRVFDGSVVTRGRGQGTEFDTLRDYVIGDDVRSIDWRATARRSDVVVRTWRPERDRRVVCVLDTGRTSAVRVGSTSVDAGAVAEPRLDAAIDAALLLAELAGRAGDSVEVFAVDSAVRAAVTTGSARTLLARMVTALAPVQPALVETDFSLLVGEVLRRERKRALVVLFTALEPGALGEGLLPVLTQLTTKHKVVIAAVHDPELEDLTRRRGTVGDVYLAAAAHRTIGERHRIRAALTKHGVEVVDAPVQIFASRVADAYLSMKAAGRL